ncbi:MAG: histidinol-phosphate transaminase [Deltaproteobacteria bacterium]|jgi:histidinol-phosphate aminotransferase|nr:histidinol-phosphate transaminase [Deltaproteobacteria bacterium]
MSQIDISTIVAPCIRDLDVYVPGRLIEDVLEEAGLSSAIKLASNENSLGPSPKAIEAVSKALGGLAKYGDADSRRLRQAISLKTGHPVEGILAGNGSSEFILVISHALLQPGLSAVMSRPSFTLYAKNAQAAGAEVREIPLGPDYGHDLNKIVQNVDLNTRLVFVDNPLNPTGAYLGPEKVLALLEQLPQTTLLVLDEAYIDFCRAPRPDYASLLATGRVVILRTFSKIFGLAGLRAAYALLDPKLAAELNKVRQPFNLNNLAQIAITAALNDQEHLLATLAMNADSMNRFGQQLPALGLTVYPTEANFIMVGLPSSLTADALVAALLKEGVIIRSLKSFGLPHHVRINAGTPHELDVLFAALQKVMAASGR